MCGVAMATVLFIGDPHIQTSNIPEVDIFIRKMVKLARDAPPDIIIIAGDLLHTHERLHTLALNKACELVHKMRAIALTYVLVGNHDYIQNQQFLTENHWMNGLKEWDNTIIVDKVRKDTINGEPFVFVPYVPPGRFMDALNTLGEPWNDAACIFAHQEFFGCKMGAIVSEEGDKWPLDGPYIVSGHIHSKQTPQSNIYYTGSAMQHAFGESDQNIIARITFQNRGHVVEEIDLELPRKKIVYMDVEDIDTYTVPVTKDKIKLTLKGDYDQFKAVKKTVAYKRLVEQGVKVVFKPTNKLEPVPDDVAITTTSVDVNFRQVLDAIVKKEKNPYLMQAYEKIVHDTIIDVDDILYV